MKTIKNKQISEETLHEYLCELHQTLQSINGIKFFNINSFYKYIGFYMNENDSNKIIHLLTMVEPYIPIIASDDNIDIFLEAALQNNVAEVVRLENEFILGSKIQFIHELITQENDDEWRNTIDTCQAIRKYKTEGIFF